MCLSFGVSKAYKKKKTFCNFHLLGTEIALSFSLMVSIITGGSILCFLDKNASILLKNFHCFPLLLPLLLVLSFSALYFWGRFFILFWTSLTENDWQNPLLCSFAWNPYEFIGFSMANCLDESLFFKLKTLIPLKSLEVYFKVIKIVNLSYL